MVEWKGSGLSNKSDVGETLYSASSSHDLQHLAGKLFTASKLHFLMCKIKMVIIISQTFSWKLRIVYGKKHSTIRGP